MNFINKTSTEVLQIVNGIARHTSVALIGYACLGNAFPSDEDIPSAIKYLSLQIVQQHLAANAALMDWREARALPQLTTEERWLFEQEDLPVLPETFPLETLVLLTNAQHVELMPQIEMTSNRLHATSLNSQERYEQLVQLHRSCLRLMTFSRWISDYMSRLTPLGEVSADNILSPDHAPDVMLFHVMRECRSPMTALIGYTDMLLSLHTFTEDQRNSIVEKINRCCQTIQERSYNLMYFVESWLDETNRDSVTYQPDLVFGEMLRSPQYYAELINSTYLAFMSEIQYLAVSLNEDPHNTAVLQQIFDNAQFINIILRHSYDFFH